MEARRHISLITSERSLLASSYSSSRTFGGSGTLCALPPSATSLGSVTSPRRSHFGNECASTPTREHPWGPIGGPHVFNGNNRSRCVSPPLTRALAEPCEIVTHHTALTPWCSHTSVRAPFIRSHIGSHNTLRGLKISRTLCHYVSNTLVVRSKARFIRAAV